MMTKAEAGERQLQARQGSGPIRSQEEARKDSPAGFRGRRALATLPFQTCSLENGEPINSCHLQSLSLWYFVTGTPGN